MATHPVRSKGLKLNPQKFAVATASRSISAFITTEGVFGFVQPGALIALLVEGLEGSVDLIEGGTKSLPSPDSSSASSSLSIRLVESGRST